MKYIELVYIKQKKSDLTGAISSVRNRESLKIQPVSNLAAKYAGKGFRRIG
jgi:hypothetical protein